MEVHLQISLRTSLSNQACSHCDFCLQNIWGVSPGLFCRDCGLNAHKACEMKVAPDCSQRRAAKSTKKTKRSVSMVSSTATSKAASETILRLTKESSRSRPDAERPASLSSTAKSAVVLFDYVATDQRDDEDEHPELTVKAGDAILVYILDEGAGWSLISHGDKIGLIPRTYMKLDDKHEHEKSSSKKGTIAFDFTKTNLEEVSVKTGDSVTVLTNLGDGWIKIACPAGKEGIIPASYIRD
jgi:hypothetical protein